MVRLLSRTERLMPPFSPKKTHIVQALVSAMSPSKEDALDAGAHDAQPARRDLRDENSADGAQHGLTLVELPELSGVLRVD